MGGMRTALCLLMLIALAPAGDDRPRRDLDDPELQEAINRAIARGMGHLKRAQAPDGSWSGRMDKSANWLKGAPNGGLTALALYALSASGLPADDLAIQRGVEWVRMVPAAYWPDGGAQTYSVSLLVLALTRIDPVGLRDLIHRYAGRIQRGQLSSGDWTYELGGPTGTPTRSGDPAARAAWRKGSLPRGIPDNSNTQFAVLGLWAAYSLAGYDVPGRVWEKIKKHYVKGQFDSGAWSYRKVNKSASDTMTAAGIVSLIYAMAALDPRPEALDRARKSGPVGLGLRAFHASSKRRPGRLSNFYWLYSVERVGTVAGLAELDWYIAGARHLISTQDDNGAWPRWSPALVKPATFGTMPRPRRPAQAEWSRVYETSLALLFLSRATYPPRKGAVTPHDRGPARPATVSGETSFPDLIDPSPGREQRIERALTLYTLYGLDRRRALAPLFGVVGPSILPRLFDRLESDVLQTREGAWDLLERIVEKRFVYDPSWSESRRKLMLRAMRRFWAEQGASLAWDGAKQSFRLSDR